MSVISKKKILTVVTAAAIILTGLSVNISAAEPVPTSILPDELITRKLKTHDPSLATSVEAVLYKLKRNQRLTLVDVRRGEDFERLHIPGSINIALYAVKTKSYLKSAPVVLVNEGFQYAALENECRRLAERGYKVTILNGGLPAWKRQGGQLIGDRFALVEMKAVSPQAFFRAKDHENTLVVDISSQRSEASGRLIPYAKHLPFLDDTDGSMLELRRFMKNNRPFQSIVIFNEAGENYEKAEKIMNRMGIDTYHLQGGVVEYQKFLDGLLLSWKPREGRMKTVSKRKPCGQELEKEASQIYEGDNFQ